MKVNEGGACKRVQLPITLKASFLKGNSLLLCCLQRFFFMDLWTTPIPLMLGSKNPLKRGPSSRGLSTSSIWFTPRRAQKRTNLSILNGASGMKASRPNETEPRGCEELKTLEITGAASGREKELTTGDLPSIKTHTHARRQGENRMGWGLGLARTCWNIIWKMQGTFAWALVDLELVHYDCISAISCMRCFCVWLLIITPKQRLYKSQIKENRPKDPVLVKEINPQAEPRILPQPDVKADPTSNRNNKASTSCRQKSQLTDDFPACVTCLFHPTWPHWSTCGW